MTLHNNYHQELNDNTYLRFDGDHDAEECETWGDNRCGRCGGTITYLEEKAEVAEYSDDGGPESGPHLVETHILVHVSCMKEGEEVA